MPANVVDPVTVLLFGRSGVGKGTIAHRLIDTLERLDPARDVLYVETGARFREFAQRGSYTSALVDEVMREGGLMPAFLPIWAWTSSFVDAFTGSEHLVLDGMARKLHEAPILESALRFYERPRVDIVFLDASRESCRARLQSRGRPDDTPEDIERRLAWFDDEARPALDYLVERAAFRYHRIDAEAPVDAVHAAVAAALDLPAD